MSRYIDADALQKLFNEVSTSLLCRRELTKDTEHMVRAFIMVTEMIQDAPTVDVVPVVHGRWERIGIRGRKGLQIYPCCSACGMVSAAYRSEWEGLRGAWKFCPNCGARMDADTQEREDV